MKEWTVMVYMAGNNNLSDDMISAINGIRSGLNSGPSDVAFVAHYECAHPAVASHRYDFLNSPDAVEFTSTRFDRVGESMEDFVDWATHIQPAKHYALILSGHGDGFQGRTLLLDESPRKVVTLTELRHTIENIVSGPLGGQKLDILGFDSCVMNTLEGLYELRNSVEIWIGSQGSIPNAGWNYERLAASLSSMTEDAEKKDPKAIAKIFIAEFIEHYKSYSFGGRSVDLSACDLSFVEAAVTNINDLGGSLLATLQDENQDLVRQTVEKALLASHLKSQTFMQDQSTDLRDFCINLQTECRDAEKNTYGVFGNSELTPTARTLTRTLSSLQAKCKKIIDSISPGRLLIKSGFCGAEYQYSYGVSLFFPWSFFALEGARPIFQDLEFSKGEGEDWSRFLGYFLESTIRSPRNEWENSKQPIFHMQHADWPSASLSHRDENEHDRAAPPYYKDDPPRSRFNPPFNKDNQPNIRGESRNSRQSPPLYKGDPPHTKDDPPVSRSNVWYDKGLGADLSYFGRIKNFPLNLTTFGGEE